MSLSDNQRHSRNRKRSLDWSIYFKDCLLDHALASGLLYKIVVNVTIFLKLVLDADAIFAFEKLKYMVRTETKVKISINLSKKSFTDASDFASEIMARLSPIRAEMS